ncbi:Uncharacterised protein [Mycobacteroides abscessus subsp. abscessus]|nr:Uncharacterised protein [Mycobacteroides abscessus subsp. abscessus]
MNGYCRKARTTGHLAVYEVLSRTLSAEHPAFGKDGDP